MAFGIDDAVAGVAGIVNAVIARAWPDPAEQAKAQLAVAQMTQTGELAQLAADTEIVKSQLAINTAEATNPSVFVAGWRPFIGWIAGAGLAVAYLVVPLVRMVASVIHAQPIPPYETGDLMTLLFAMLGMGALKSFDMVRGTATTRLSR